MQDDALWEMVQREERLLITTDKGFTHYCTMPHYGILVVRLRKPNRHRIHHRIMRVMAHFAVCINNEGYQASLEVGKLYRVIPDVEAASHGYLRIVDESGEDYGYTADRFFPLDVPQALAEALQLAE